MEWLKGKESFRDGSIAMVLIGVWVGFMLALESYIFAIIWGLLEYGSFPRKAKF